jgi:hypothetical protein
MADVRGGAPPQFAAGALCRDRPSVEDDPLFSIPTHMVFSAEALRATAGLDDLGPGLERMAAHSNAFLAASDGANDMLYLANINSRNV